MRRKAITWAQNIPSTATLSRYRLRFVMLWYPYTCLPLFVSRLSQGFEGFLSSKDVLKRRTRALKVEDRAFSLSSKTSYAVGQRSFLCHQCLPKFCVVRVRVFLQTTELQQAEEAPMQDGERPHFGRSARHASKVRHGTNSYQSSSSHSTLTSLCVPRSGCKSCRQKQEVTGQSYIQWVVVAGTRAHSHKHETCYCTGFVAKPVNCSTSLVAMSAVTV